MATLMLELLLTRIWSVTMWYHFAFVALSVAMFGMTTGAVIVYLFPKVFVVEKSVEHLSLGCLLFSLASIFSFLTSLCIPFVLVQSFVGFYQAGLFYANAALPFCVSGVCMTLALTKFPQQVAKLYACDLIGAAIGCVGLVAVLNLTDGPTAVFVAALLGAGASIAFALEAGKTSYLKCGALLGLLLVSFVTVNTIQVQKQAPLIRFIWSKGEREQEPLYERWNAFSRVTVHGDPKAWEEPEGMGLSSTYHAKEKVHQLHFYLDGFSQTVLTGAAKNIQDLDYLKCDATNIGYYLLHDARVLIVGAGGGREIFLPHGFSVKNRSLRSSSIKA